MPYNEFQPTAREAETDRWSHHGVGSGSFRTRRLDSGLEPCGGFDAEIQFFPAEVNDGKVSFTVHVTDDDAELSTVVRLPPEEARAFARNVLEVADGLEGENGE